MVWPAVVTIQNCLNKACCASETGGGALWLRHQIEVQGPILPPISSANCSSRILNTWSFSQHIFSTESVCLHIHCFLFGFVSSFEFHGAADKSLNNFLCHNNCSITISIIAAIEKFRRGAVTYLKETVDNTTDGSLNKIRLTQGRKVAYNQLKINQKKEVKDNQESADIWRKIKKLICIRLQKSIPEQMTHTGRPVTTAQRWSTILPLDSNGHLSVTCTVLLLPLGAFRKRSIMAALIFPWPD